MKDMIISFLILAATSVSYARPSHEHRGTAHLEFANGAIHAHATWIQGPQLSPGESILQLEWKNGADHSPVEPPGIFKLALWMPHSDPGLSHGSAPTRIRQVLDNNGQPLPGVYEVYRIYFTMGGKWDVNVTLKHADGSEETKTIKVELNEGGGHRH
ncbi:MAG: hypothetical protein AB7G93_16780 [Bdellovibrionales bacterium]